MKTSHKISLTVVVLLIIAGILAACNGFGRNTEPASNTNAEPTVIPTVVPTAIPTEVPEEAPAEEDAAPAEEEEPATFELNPEDQVSGTWRAVPDDGIRFEGVPDSVPADNVDHARGKQANGFTPEWPALSHVLAEPGKLAVGPDFPQEKIDSSGGAIWRSDEGNAYRLQSMTGEQLDGCAEGAFMYISGQHMRIESARGPVVEFKVPDGDNAHIYLRCPFSDGQQGSDAGTDVLFSMFKPNHVKVQHFSGNPNGGFVSSDGSMQALGISQAGQSSGSEGANHTWVIGLDLNTGAYTVMVWDGTTMTLIATNWYQQ